MAGRAKGSLLVHVADHVVAREGRAAWTTAVGRLGPIDRATLAGIVLVGSWYPVGLWNRLVRAWVDGRDPTLLAEAMRYVAARDMPTVFRMILRSGTPEAVLRRCDPLYARYFEGGHVGAEPMPTPKNDRRWTLWLDAPMGEEDGPGELTCSQAFRGWMLHAMSIVGAKEAHVMHVRCRFRGHPRCEYEASWRA